MPAKPLVLTLPLPPPELHAHAKGHWRAKAKATKTCRTRAHVETLARQWPRFRGVILSINFYFPDMRHRDTLNVVQGVKPYIDGIVDAGVFPGDHWVVLSIGHIRSHLDRDNPRVEISIKEKL